ncbi:uncharacterized protein LAESUDRAFT_729281 [Laetiporus sulphureus 93-53]|uniref:Extracellular metalloproteinase n=1 Tax=Laetiporus sulphureus 93-53 TaxID=1314785 RepID=A0A165CQR2_9APHY|nr:uncharacterized protein LAESUDRAFT_729281 [Laetiporus sulphureus 93-53]KZT03251.1 hypothetical protein LAESUDRAFT_729281 [Laetiporus sulphureus 93-53]
MVSVIAAVAMYRLILAALAALGLKAESTSPAEPSFQLLHRKTLGFGPLLSHAAYHTESFHPSSSISESANEPFAVAERFVRELTRDADPLTSFFIRNDSYTDRTTDITHVYVSQHVDGSEILNGHISVNVKDGIILSYSDSIFRGYLQESFLMTFVERAPDVHSEHCTNLLAALKRNEERFQIQNGQFSLRSTDFPLSETLASQRRLYEWNCAHVDTPFLMAEKPAFAAQQDREWREPEPALLQFMIAVTSNDTLAQQLIDDPGAHLRSMATAWERHRVNGHYFPVAIVDNVPDAVKPVRAKLAYMQVPRSGSTVLELVWQFEVEMQHNWYEATVSADLPHRIISVADWVSDSPIPLAPVSKRHASYNVFKWGINDPSLGKRTMEKEHFDRAASPMGWHSLPYANDPISVRDHVHSGPHGEKWRNTTTTWGNNVFAHEKWDRQRADWESSYRPDAGKSLVFDWVYNPRPTERKDLLDEARRLVNVSVTQLFYTSNMVHDLYYRYGFDEAAGNFQQYNFGNGGQENDAIIANAQDSTTYNNAQFWTPPDGQNGRCDMYLFSTANPYRDAALDAGLVIHELTHGLSTRLTGGPGKSDCLAYSESKGMGEGWGDFLATTIRSTREYSDYPIGAWAQNRTYGMRDYPYSIDKDVNPLTYESVDVAWGAHAIGEVWAEMLWVVSNRLIKKHGFADSLFPPEPLIDGIVPEGDFYRTLPSTENGVRRPPIPKHGNSLMVQLVLNAMKLQPCRPTFFQARDAIIQADAILTGEENYCDIWAGFAECGLGPNAKVEGETPWGGGDRTDDFTVPARCKSIGI